MTRSEVRSLLAVTATPCMDRRCHVDCSVPGHQRQTDALKEVHMIFLGVALLVLGLFANIPILWPVGIILLVVGIVFELRGMAGHAVRGRRHYY